MRHFFVFVFALLIPCFALWTALSALLAVPAMGFVHTALTNWFPDVVHGLHLQGAEGVLMTEFGESNGRLGTSGQFVHRAGNIGALAESAWSGLPPVEKCLYCHNYIIKKHPQIQKEHNYFNTQTPTPWVKVNYIP